jgi:hypothetical protein
VLVRPHYWSSPVSSAVPLRRSAARSLLAAAPGCEVNGALPRVPAPCRRRSRVVADGRQHRYVLRSVRGRSARRTRDGVPPHAARGAVPAVRGGCRDQCAPVRALGGVGAGRAGPAVVSVTACATSTAAKSSAGAGRRARMHKCGPCGDVVPARPTEWVAVATRRAISAGATPERRRHEAPIVCVIFVRFTLSKSATCHVSTPSSTA